MVKRGLIGVWVVVSLLLSMVVKGEDFIVHGRAEGLSGEKVRIIVPADPFSGKEVTLASAVIDSLGCFRLQSGIKTTQFAWISLGFGRSEIYLYPGIDLEIRLSITDSVKAGRNPFLEPPLLRLVLIAERPGSLNRDISLFNTTYDEFVAKCATALQNRRNRTITDSLDRLLKGLPLDAENAYLKAYIFYKLADIHVFLRGMSYPLAYKKYVETQSPDFDNVAYTDFFNGFFDNYLFSHSKIKFVDDLTVGINRNVDLNGLLDSLGKDSLLRNERIRELVLLKHLHGMYYDKNYSGTNILHMLKTLSVSSKFIDNRKISENLLYVLTRFDAGSPLPAFRFLSPSGSPITEKSLGAGITCLIFFRNACDLCDAEHELIPALEAKFSGKIRFLSVCCEPGGTGLISYLRNHPKFKWDFADFNDDYQFLETMEIRSYPMFLLTEDGARIKKYPAKKPSEGFEEILFE